MIGVLITTKNSLHSISDFAHVAQLVEHVFGKDEVTSSSLVMGSNTNDQRDLWSESHPSN